MQRLRILLSGLLVIATALAGDPVSLAELLPGKTLVYIETRNPPLEELKQQALWQCMEEPALKKALERMFAGDTMSEAMPLGSGALFMRSDLRDMSFELRYVDRKGTSSIKMRDRFAFAWVGVVEGPLPIDAVIAVNVTDPGQAIKTAKRIIAALRMSKKKRNVEAEMGRLFTAGTHREQEYTRIHIEGISIYMAALGKMLLVATTEVRMTKCIDRLKDGAKGSLASTERYRDILANARGTGSMTTIMAIQIDRVLDALEPMIPAPIAMVRGGLGGIGLSGLKTISSVSRIDGAGVSNTMSILFDRDPHSPFLKPGKPMQFRSLAFAPKDTFYVNCMGISSETISALVTNPMAAGMFRNMFDLRLKEDLVDLIGDELGFIISPNKGLIPDIAFVLHSTDAARLEASLVKMAGKIPWPAGTAMHSPDIRGAKAHVVPLMHPGLGIIPLAPTFGVVGDVILIAPSPLAFRRFVAVSQGAKPNINQNRDFAKLREMVPENAGGASYLDLPRMVGFVYDTVVPFIQAVPQPTTGGVSIYELPESEVFTKHLYGRIAWTQTDERGWHWVSHAPMDMSGFMIAGAVGAGAMFYLVRPEPTWNPGIPAPMMPVHDHEAMNCSANVHMLAARIRFYRRKNKSMPKTLEDIKAEHLPEDTFIVPGTDMPYVYLGPDGVGKLLLHGHPNGKDKRICVLTRKMKVRRVTQKQLKQMLEPQSTRKPRR